MATLETRLRAVLGDRTAKALESLFGMATIGDLLRHYPRRYVARGELSDIDALIPGDEVTVLAEISSTKSRHLKGRTITEVVLSDGKAKLHLTFFNQAWRERELKAGRTGLFAGKVGRFNNVRQLSHPDYQLIPDGDDVDEAISAFAGKFLPVYPAAAKMPSWKIAQCIEIALDSLDEIPDYLPEEFRGEYPDLAKAFNGIHRPESMTERDLALARLTFDEALLLQLRLGQRRAELKKLHAKPRPSVADGLVRHFDAQLPFALTAGQKEVIAEIESDMQAPHPMHRLLQGEVGSGKTVVAVRAMLTVVDAGGQAALLAPTEVLAAQHFATITRLLGPLAERGTLQGSSDGTSVVLLTGSMSAARKRAIQAEIKNGEAGIIIGTHALLSEGVDFSDLGLVVIDEQHRFGVEQRDALRSKAQFPPHLLVMTATPIPRTVAMTIFGDLDISTLRELPGGRSPIQTHVIAAKDKPHYLQRAWQRVREEVDQGHQVYVVAARISATEVVTTPKITDRDRAMAALLGDSFDNEETAADKGLIAVEDLAPQLATGELKGLKIAMLHGRLSSEEKDATMQAFSAGLIDVLIATTVIEVGVDVPNASMMVIMDADRFGVSQLHQLRGRVGRGGIPGLCLLVTNIETESLAMARLQAVASTLDGFELSRIDLDQRREGDVLGKAQSGTRSHLRLLRVLRDEALIEKARALSQKIISHDATLAAWPELAHQITELKNDEAATFMDKG